MLVDRLFLMHNFCTVMNGEATAFWDDQSQANLALIAALTALDQEEPAMSHRQQDVCCTENKGLQFWMHMQNLLHTLVRTDLCSSQMNEHTCAARQVK